MHFSFPFDVKTGAMKLSAPSLSYQDIAAMAIGDCMEENSKITAITPSTLYATGLADIFALYPDRCFDPGMEEQHAVTMAVGMALSGMRPVLFYQSTFLQRAFDQIIHDVCFSNQDILILAVRSGFAGYDNPTHHGIYDLTYLRGLPNLRIYYPRNSKELYEITTLGLTKKLGPTLVLMPYGNAEPQDFTRKEQVSLNIETPELLLSGKDGIILSVGNKVSSCKEAVDLLSKNNLSYGLVNLRQIKPLAENELLKLIDSVDHVVTVEEGVLEGGVGASVSALMHRHRIAADLTMIGLPCSFIEAGSNEELCSKYGLDAEGISRQIYEGRK
jgi:1-deoxy-D-xylulose-5-phosphate synthase